MALTCRKNYNVVELNDRLAYVTIQGPTLFAQAVFNVQIWQEMVRPCQQVACLSVNARIIRSE